MHNKLQHSIGSYKVPVSSALDSMILRETKWSGVVIDRESIDGSDKFLDNEIAQSGSLLSYYYCNENLVFPNNLLS